LHLIRLTFMLKKQLFIIGITLTLLLTGSCTKPPDYPIEPIIKFLSMSKTKLKQSSINADSLRVTFSFTDGDGDIGSNDSLSLFVIDKRDGFVSSKYKIPFVTESGATNGISGEVEFVIFTTCCYFPDGQAPCTPSLTFPTDTVIYDIYLKDRAGHKSNIIQTLPIVLDCTK
jgi:hypothetical protein